MDQALDVNGQDLVVDSFDSRDPLASTEGQYDPAKVKSFGDMTCNGSVTNSIPSGGATIFGHVAIGPVRIFAPGPESGIGSHAWLAIHPRTIEPNGSEGRVWLSTDAHFAVPSFPLPYNSGLPLPAGGKIVTGTPGQFITNDYDHIISVPADYYNSSTSLGRTFISAGGVRLVLPNGLHMAADDIVMIAPQASAKFYVGGSAVLVAGNGILNSNVSGNFMMFCALTVNQFSFNGSGQFTGVIFAPQCHVDLNGGGHMYNDMSGAFLFRSVRLNGAFRLHFDEALRFNWCLSPLASLSVRSERESKIISVIGSAGFQYIVQGSTDLLEWTNLTTNSVPFDLEVSDLEARAKFFRTVSSP